MDFSFVWGHHHLHLAGMDDHSISCLIHYLLSTPSECHPFPKSTIVRIELSLLYHLFFKNICWCLNRWRHKWYKEHDHSIQSLRVKGLKVFKDPGKRGHIVAHDVSWAAQTGNIYCGSTQNVSEQNQKQFLGPRHKICVRNKRYARGQKGKYLCRQKCVCNNVFATALKQM